MHNIKTNKTNCVVNHIQKAALSVLTCALQNQEQPIYYTNDTCNRRRIKRSNFSKNLHFKSQFKEKKNKQHECIRLTKALLVNQNQQNKSEKTITKYIINFKKKKRQPFAKPNTEQVS